MSIFVTIVVLLVGLAAAYVQHRLSQPIMTVEKLAAMRAEVSAQKRDGSFYTNPNSGNLSRT